MRAAAFVIPIFLLGMFVSPDARAGTIRLVGEPFVEAVPDGEGIHLTGRFEMRNDGDETAREVFPALELGGWVYAGEPADINAGQQHVWQIDGAISAEQLGCRADAQARCAGLDLPRRGAFPMFVRKHYRDLNGKAFSAPAVRTIFVGN